MIPSARFGTIRVIEKTDEYVICNLYSLYENGIQDVASNKEFCFFILVELCQKLSLHDRQFMQWDGLISRKQAKSLYEKLDETTLLFYEESYTLLNSESIDIAKNEMKFKEIAQKIIETFSVSDIETMSDTWEEFATLEFKVSNIKALDHITHGLLVES